MLEILETVKVSEALLKRCHELKARGFTLALDDFTGQAHEFTGLLDIVDIVKVDVQNFDEKGLSSITARLQELDEPGGILISGPVYDQVHNKLSIGFDCLGRQQLKNVANPVTGYRVLQGGEAPRPQPSQIDGRREPAIPPPPADNAQADFFSRAWGWYIRLPRLSAVMIAIVVFLFAINMFSGPSHIWFQWPAAVLLLIAFLRAASRSRRLRTARLWRRLRA